MDTPESTSSVTVLSRWLGISRNAIYKLARNRERTHFPQPPWQRPQVEQWYLDFEPGGGPRRGIKADQKEVDTSAV